MGALGTDVSAIHMTDHRSEFIRLYAIRASNDGWQTHCSAPTRLWQVARRPVCFLLVLLHQRQLYLDLCHAFHPLLMQCLFIGRAFLSREVHLAFEHKSPHLPQQIFEMIGHWFFSTKFLSQSDCTHALQWEHLFPSRIRWCSINNCRGTENCERQGNYHFSNKTAGLTLRVRARSTILSMPMPFSPRSTFPM